MLKQNRKTSYALKLKQPRQYAGAVFRHICLCFISSQPLHVLFPSAPPSLEQ